MARFVLSLLLLTATALATQVAPPRPLVGPAPPNHDTSALAGVTFNKEVLPILQKNCQVCHRPGEAAPMSFLTYESARPWAKAPSAVPGARSTRPCSSTLSSKKRAENNMHDSDCPERAATSRLLRSGVLRDAPRRPDQVRNSTDFTDWFTTKIRMLLSWKVSDSVIPLPAAAFSTSALFCSSAEEWL